MQVQASQQDDQTASARTRLAVLGALLALGLVLALAGHAVGLPAGLTDPDPGASFRVSEDNVTVSADGTEVTAVDRMTNVSGVEISETDGAFVIKTDRDNPLTDRQRNTSLAVARANDTVAGVLDDLDGYMLTVEPIRKLEATNTVNITMTNITANTAQASEGLATAINATDENETFDVTLYGSTSNGSDAVRVDRDPSYVDGRAVVYVRNTTTDERILSVVVDVENEAVASLTDRRERR
ncbi:hypothetical protein SAMN05216226_11257 [Halovenus aranensis]|uniref:Uncharacterized protein n=1 Tax=Halovenus aranensis TaxID=890420 RepID=A0A1G8XS79_9EURY|nr:hypothetical protein [Halovenus aranensis]SDJ93522.1 hypothetical protein SAMN05216226_11257 [Halovenus aranensis]